MPYSNRCEWEGGTPPKSRLLPPQESSQGSDGLEHAKTSSPKRKTSCRTSHHLDKQEPFWILEAVAATFECAPSTHLKSRSRSCQFWADSEEGNLSPAVVELFVHKRELLPQGDAAILPLNWRAKWTRGHLGPLMPQLTGIQEWVHFLAEVIIPV